MTFWTKFHIFKIKMSATLKIISKYKTAIKDNYSILYSANKGVKAQVFEDIATISGIDRNELAERVFGRNCNDAVMTQCARSRNR